MFEIKIKSSDVRDIAAALEGISEDNEHDLSPKDHRTLGTAKILLEMLADSMEASYQAT